MLIGLSIALLALLANLVMTHKMRLIVVALLLVPQLYVPGLPLTLAMFWTLITCVAGLTAQGRPRASSHLVVLMGLFVGATTLSLLWALPSSLSAGVETVFRGALFFLWLREVIVLAKEDSRLLDTIAMWAIPGIAAQAVLAITFQIFPDIEERFLRSGLAALTIGPGAGRLFSDMPNNVLEPGKSGGFFVNGNMASLFGGVAALVLLVVARRNAIRWMYFFAALSLTGAIFTGSKTAFLVVIAVVITALFLPHMLRGWAALLAVPVMLLVPLMFSVMLTLVERIAPNFFTASDTSFSGRSRMWRTATQLFMESPYFGLGFGGWAQQIGRFPPHNFVIAAWADSGIFAALLAVVFIVAAVVLGLRVAAVQPTLRDRRTVVFALCAIAWVFIHGMGDNTALYGEQRSMYLVALAFGYLYVMKRKPQGRVEYDEIDNQVGRHAVVTSSAHAHQ